MRTMRLRRTLYLRSHAMQGKNTAAQSRKP